MATAVSVQTLMPSNRRQGARRRPDAPLEAEAACPHAATGGQPNAILLNAILGNLHRFAIFERRLVRHNASNRHVERLGDVDQRLAVLQDRHDKLVHELAV